VPLDILFHSRPIGGEPQLMLPSAIQDFYTTHTPTTEQPDMKTLR